MENLFSFLNAMPGALSQGLIWGVMAIGVYITYRILEVSDLTVDGSFCTGGAVCIMMLLGGYNVWIAMLAAVIAGMLAGLVTGIFHTVCGIPAILAGILTQLGLWSVNLALAARRGKARTLLPGITKAERDHYREQLKILDLGLEDRMTAKVGLLSGGQRQALTLLMATLQQPKLLLLDEHTAALDPKTAAKVLSVTQRIVEQGNLTTLMITHNMRDAITYGNRLVMMYDGRIVVDVSGEEKKNLTVEQLLDLFSQASGSDEVSDKLVLS